MKNDKVRGIKAVKEFEYNELIKLGKFKDAQKIADANAEWYQSEYQRWTDLAGEAMLGWVRVDLEPSARPENCTDENLVYLDELRESGEINMFGAKPYLVDEFELEESDAKKILLYWMDTFAERHNLQ